MKNYFNLEVCFGEVPLMPYEWEHTTNLMHVKLIRVQSSIIKSILSYGGKLKCNEKCVVVSDGKETVALKLGEDGKILKRSFLTFDDALELAEFANNLKVSRVEFISNGEKLKYPPKYCIEKEMEEVLVDAINKSHDEDLTKYLYYLYFNDVNGYSRDKLIESIKSANLDKNMKLYKFLIKN